MPTYEYKCSDCGGLFEVFQNMTAAPLTVCRECGGPLKRLLGSGAGIIFKGSGFYETDYRKKTSAESKRDNGGDKESATREAAPKSDSAVTKKSPAKSSQPAAAE